MYFVKEIQILNLEAKGYTTNRILVERSCKQYHSWAHVLVSTPVCMFQSRRHGWARTPTPSPKCSNSNKAHFVHLGTSADHEYLWWWWFAKWVYQKATNYVHLRIQEKFFCYRVVGQRISLQMKPQNPTSSKRGRQIMVHLIQMNLGFGRNNESILWTLLTLPSYFMKFSE